MASEWTCEALAVAVESVPGKVFERVAKTVREFGLTGADLVPHLSSQDALRGFFHEYYDTVSQPRRKHELICICIFLFLFVLAVLSVAVAW